jgi:hypothetical protein
MSEADSSSRALYASLKERTTAEVDVPKSEAECLRAIDDALSATLLTIRNEAQASSAHLRTIKRIAVWFLFVSVVGMLLGLIALGSR